MEIDTSSVPQVSVKKEELKKPTENSDDWQHIKQMQSAGPAESSSSRPETASNVSF
jgi:hypothetical protein